MDTIYDNIKWLCFENGISIHKLEKTLGFSNSTIKGWEKSVPSSDRLAAVAEFFRVPIETLKDGEKLRKVLDPTFGEIVENINSQEIDLLQMFRKLDQHNKYIILGKIAELIKEQQGISEDAASLTSKVG